MKETTQHLGDAVELVTIQEPKFSTDVLHVMLLLPYEPEKSPAYCLAMSMLAQSCRKYPNNKAISARLDQLYGLSIGTGTVAYGDTLRLTFSASCIADRYAFGGEALLREAAQIAADCLFDPNVTDGAFDPGEFAMQQREAIDAIRNDTLDLRLFARQRFHRTFFEGEPSAFDTSGTVEQVEALGPQSVYAAYQELLRRASVRIYCVGPDADAEALAPLRDGFAALTDRAPAAFTLRSPSPRKDEVRRVTERLPIQQSKLLLGFKSETPLDIVHLRVFNALFGAMPTSLLFANVRERMSLCYYCVSAFYAEKQGLIVDSGIDSANAGRVEEAVREQLAVIAEGRFEDAALENVKRALTSAVRGIGDTPGAIVANAFDKFRFGEDLSPAVYLERIAAVTREDVMAVAAAYRLDTVYLLEEEK